MRIAQIVADGRPGGGSTMVLGLIDDLLARRPGDCVTLVSQPGSWMEREAATRGLPFMGFDFFAGGFDPRLPSRFARRLGEAHFDVTHLHGLRAAHHAVRWPVRDRLGALAYTVHGLHQLHQAFWLRWPANIAERQVMRRVGEVVFVSHADRDTAQRLRLLPRSRSGLVVHNGIDMTDVQRRYRADRNVDAVFVGRLVEQKNPEQALRVLMSLSRSGRQCLLAGGGELGSRCDSLLLSAGASSVQRLGELSRDEALDLLARSRVLLMPSRWEGLPLLPIEAMALGVPVVATRLPGIAEVVVDGVTGMLVPAGDEAAMHNAAEQLLNDPALWRRMSEAGRERIVSLFDRSSGSAAYMRLYAKLSGAGAA